MFPLFNEAYKPSLMAQMLNDEAALMIERGEYQEAIAHLVKALRLYEEVADAYVACTCNHCRLEYCIARSRRSRGSSTQSSSMYCSTCMDIDDDEEADSRSGNISGGYIYRRPIYCSPTFSHEGHHPGVTLMMIIVFNLALAHHLVSITSPHFAPTPMASEIHTRLSKALQLYELFYQLQMEREIFSTQAMLAVANNVGEIHRIVGNRSKYQMCLEHLMSCIMLVVEDHRDATHYSRNDTGQDNLPTSSTTSPRIRGRRSHSSGDGDLKASCDSEEMDGFLRNASQLVLRNNCAGAA